MLTISVVTNAMEAVQAEWDPCCGLISLAGLEMDGFFSEEFDQELVDRSVIAALVSFDASIRRM